MIQEKEAINCNAERKLKEMNKHCTDQLEKQQQIIEEQQLILCNGTEASSLFKIRNESRSKRSS